MKKIIQYALGILFSVCLMTVLLFTSIEAAVYWTPGYFEKEYEKYQVTEAVQMTMDDLLKVTEEMMSYLRGGREDLHVMTTINGTAREFFNEREIAHMEDVRGLFLGAVAIRRFCLVLMAFCTVALLLTKADFKRLVPKSVLTGSGLFFAASALCAFIISTDFTKYFTLFHHIFFQNDLWILDPSTDMLINIVPESFFKDTVLFIAVIFFACVLAVLGSCLFFLCKYRKNRK